MKRTSRLPALREDEIPCPAWSRRRACGGARSGVAWVLRRSLAPGSFGAPLRRLRGARSLARLPRSRPAPSWGGALGHQWWVAASGSPLRARRLPPPFRLVAPVFGWLRPRRRPRAYAARGFALRLSAALALTRSNHASAALASRASAAAALPLGGAWVCRVPVGLAVCLAACAPGRFPLPPSGGGWRRSRRPAALPKIVTDTKAPVNRKFTDEVENQLTGMQTHKSRRAA